GRHRQQVTLLVQGLQDRIGGWEQHRRGWIGAQEIMAIAVREPLMKTVILPGEQGIDGLPQSQPDDVPDRALAARLQPQVLNGSADARDNARNGIHHGPVPVEHQQLESVSHLYLPSSPIRAASHRRGAHSQKLPPRFRANGMQRNALAETIASGRIYASSG